MAMFKYGRAVQDSSGNAITGVIATFTLAGTATAASLFSDYAGASPIVGNAVADTSGWVQCYLEGGVYDVVVTKSGATIATYSGETTWGTQDLASTSDATKGDYLIGVKSALTGGTARTQHAKNAEFVSVMDFGADNTGATASDAAFALAATATLSKKLRIPAGTYKLVTAGSWVCAGFSAIEGDGSGVTKIIFQPTAAGACLRLANGAAQTVLVSVKGIWFYSNETVFQKTAILVDDSSSVTLDDIYIGGSGVGVPDAPYWHDAANTSIGISSRGREATNISNIRCFADYPIYIGNNPNASAQILADIDHWHFHNLYLIGLGRYCITVEAGIGMSHAVFDGYQAWVGGTGGISMNDTRVAGGGYIPSRNITFKNVRTEQITNAANYAFDIQSTSGIQQISYENCLLGSGSLGIRTTNFEHMTLRNVSMAITGSALYATPLGAMSVLELDNVLIDVTGSYTLTNMVPARISAYAPASYGMPSSATYAYTATTPYSNWTVLGKSGVASSGTAVTTEEIRATITIKGGTMGPYGALRIRTQWSTTNNAGVKTARVRLGGIGGTDFLAQPLTSFASTVNETVIVNANSVSSQSGPPPAMAGGFGQTASGPVTGAINTAADTTLVITGQKDAAGDTLTLVSYIVECAAG